MGGSYSDSGFHDVAGRSVLALLVACLCTAAVLTLLELETRLIPPVFALACALAFNFSRPLDLAGDAAPLTWPERTLIIGALALGALRLAPYAAGDITGTFTPAVTFDDHWHFQELASLVSSERFPPRLNFAPESRLHFYYLPWVPAAVLAHLVQLSGGTPWLKLCYGAGTLALLLGSAFVAVLFLRHALPPAARPRAILALLLAGAVPDGLFVLQGWAHGSLSNVEWWQDRFGIHNQVSSLTTLAVWVPHHLVAAMALLLAVVAVTQPYTLAPRAEPRAYIAAGLLAGFAAFSSVFVVIGAAVTLAPLAVRFSKVPRLALIAAVAAIVPSLPLAYIYLDAGASGGFQFLAPFASWQQRFGSAGAGLAGFAAALAFMMAEAGWLGMAAWRASAGAQRRSPLAPFGIAGFVYLASTAAVSFDGWNNYSMRGAVVPVIVLACWWADVMTRSGANAAPATVARTPARHRQRLALGAAAALALAAHANEALVFASQCARSLLGPIDDCGRRVAEANAAGRPASADLLAECRKSMALYSIERPFVKPELRAEDRELMGEPRQSR